MNLGSRSTEVENPWAAVSRLSVWQDHLARVGLRQHKWWLVHFPVGEAVRSACLACARATALACRHCAYLQARFQAAPCLLVLAAAMVLPGCASESAPPAIIRDDVLIHVRLVDQIEYKPGTEAFGLARCANDVCVLEILRDRYPFCLQHEIRHAFEGDWHPDRETLDDC
jgi:hypothetical protein